MDLFKLAALMACALPGLHLAVDLADGTLVANPLPAVVRVTGLWSLRLLLVGLALSPAASLLRWPRLLTIRRTIGSCAAGYAALHVVAWAAYYRFAIGFLLEEIAIVPYLLVGTIAFALLVPVAATSNDRAITWLGATRWRQLHALAYPIAIAAFAHNLMARRFDRSEALLSGAALAVVTVRRLARSLNASSTPRPASH